MTPDPLQRSAGLDILLGVEAEGWPELLGQDPEALARRAAQAALDRAGLPPDFASELGITLSDDESVKALNAQWRGKDKPTNILSFPARQLQVGQTPGPMMGDLILARETLEREARSESKAPADHFAHLIVHGILHLLGHDHMDENEAERMETLEIEILADLSIGDPYSEASGHAPGADTIAT
ncbi:rRNA maturation RNase YbeY [Aureimonas populi]|uniref:Endoribonuclease YbeY n=1 Tax=Aureimonas populi TaxID=1701758 RepID=A0ABW5CRX3_9HYPH|nr:rRNA maturation RNase YbeY [Aureimonas populi]